MFKTHVLTYNDVGYLDTMFGWPNIRPVAADLLHRIPQNDLSLWCLNRAIYQLPTTELIEFLQAQMGDPTRTVEIGAGAGQIGRALSIRMTDNKMQNWPLIQQHYAKLRQPTIVYGPDVELMPALRAISVFEPQTVIGCWVTEKYVPGKPVGNVHGVDEMALLQSRSVKKYILVGNRHTHGDKEIFRQYRHREYQFDWLFSRSMEKSQNAIWVFTPQNN